MRSNPSSRVGGPVGAGAERGDDRAQRFEGRESDGQRVDHPLDHRGNVPTRPQLPTDLPRRVGRRRLPVEQQVHHRLVGDPRNDVPHVEPAVGEVTGLASDPADRRTSDHDVVQPLRDPWGGGHRTFHTDPSP